jgi:hypothetical protein
LRRTVLASLLALLLTPAGADARVQASARTTCAKLYTQADHARYARAVYSRRQVTRRAQRRVGHMRIGQHSYAARVNARRLVRRLREARDERVNRRQHYLGLQAKLEAIAWCESKGNPRAIGGGGAYRGKYQFSFGTWASVGGNGDPAAASEREQDYRAALLLKRDGAGHWPVCG